MASLAAILTAASVAGVSCPGAQSAQFSVSGTRVTERHSGNYANMCDAMSEVKSTLTVTGRGVIPAITVGTKGATSITCATAGSGAGIAWGTGAAIALGSMVVVGIDASADPDGNSTYTIRAESVGLPTFVAGGA